MQNAEEHGTSPGPAADDEPESSGPEDEAPYGTSASPADRKCPALPFKPFGYQPRTNLPRWVVICEEIWADLHAVDAAADWHPVMLDYGSNQVQSEGCVGMVEVEVEVEVEVDLGLGSPSWWNQYWFYNPL